MKKDYITVQYKDQTYVFPKYLRKDEINVRCRILEEQIIYQGKYNPLINCKKNKPMLACTNF